MKQGNNFGTIPKWTGTCGELAGDEAAALVLLSMGLDEFSMSALSIPRIKRLIGSTRFELAQEMAARVLTMPTAHEISEYIDSFISQ